MSNSTELTQMITPIMTYCKEKGIPAIFIANCDDAVVKATVGNDETSVDLILKYFDGDYELQEEFGKQLEKLEDDDE